MMMMIGPCTANATILVNKDVYRALDARKLAKCSTRTVLLVFF